MWHVLGQVTSFYVLFIFVNQEHITSSQDHLASFDQALYLLMRFPHHPYSLLDLYHLSRASAQIKGCRKLQNKALL